MVIEEEFADLPAEAIVVFGSWTAKFDAASGPPPRDDDIRVVGDVNRQTVYDAADRAQARLGLPMNLVIRMSAQWHASENPLAQQIRCSPHVIVGGEGRTEATCESMDLRPSAGAEDGERRRGAVRPRDPRAVSPAKSQTCDLLRSPGECHVPAVDRE